ncbi:MAG TPA: DUF2269 domain-containing protein [Burkholderiales bacterium]|nr:DUF2269 domain-containing protein [Burkholderiales bacterium]
MSGTLALWKTAHVISATVLFGTGLGTAFFCWFGCRAAVRGGEIATLRALLRLTVIADAVFTAPAVLFQAASGLVLMGLLGWPYFSAWSIAVWGLFALVGACWLPVLAIQVHLERTARRAASIGALPGSFHRFFRIWFVLGVPAFAGVVIILYFMVAKPLALAAG